MKYKSKVDMPKELKSKCHKVIHTASAAAATAGGSPIPISDAVVISTVQIGMIVKLGEVFEITLPNSVAKSIASVTITQQAGRAVFTSILKLIPGAGTIAGAFVGALTAGSLTEALGWLVADDFYRILQGEEPENLVETAEGLGTVFSGLRTSKVESTSE